MCRTKIPPQERVLMFVQFEDLMKKVSEALDFRGIPHLQITGSASKKSNTLDQFQQNKNARVLLLNVIDESASGANLTNANHSIFLSPLLALSKQAYDARETQAIGRIRRYGQTKHVHIYRFLTLDSVDETIFMERTGMNRNEVLEECVKVADLDL
jgi:SNF2 family DNA or RNA helicase